MSRRDWMDEGTRLVLRVIGELPDDAFDAPTLLPGWTRRHLVAHLHYNAEALRRLVNWARTGVESRMYADAGQRTAEIEAGARLPVPELRRLVRGSADALAADLDALPGEAWSNEVVTAQGRTVPATEIVWMRTREVAVHAVDLGAGVDFADLPADLVRALIDDTLTRRIAQGHGPALASWFTGRTAQAPDLGPWL
ncbi:maleylpyruvate isomerase family mycothiol-dependent enzyme [Amycolatopsis granulosa]|uniref:maleylpyruvate isomerase family mycothiol-dependent enzyme n=1 Tax=Amycolatopsis granulosa TaxID=185684 RepID=UPI001FBB5374|nr:maleylpyruvate isomerase family mycothiol-dependent enzyme [Amycolatopsis granulosa]NIH83338.1 maleylpyruvate isomerase [Amycolatopsis granulosa]